MPYYPEVIDERSSRPAHFGRAQGANGFGTSASFECGSFVRFSFAIDDSSGSIADAKFQTNGCGFMTAAADTVASYLAGRLLTDLRSIDEPVYERIVERELTEFPPGRKQCLRVVLEAVRAALANHRAYLIEEFRGEKALICTCFGVSEETIEVYIAAKQPESVDEVTAECRAGGGCGSCRMMIQEMIDAHGWDRAV